MTLASLLWGFSGLTATAADTVRSDASAGYLLDDYPGARAAYSLRRLSSTFSGPVIRVRRTSDGAQQDFGLAGDDLDIAAIESWLAGSDGEAVKWYSQLPGHPALEPFDGLLPPIIAENGSVVTDELGHPRLKFFRMDGYRVGSSGLPVSIAQQNLTMHLVIETEIPFSQEGRGAVLQLGTGQWERTTYTVDAGATRHYSVSGAGTGFNGFTFFPTATSRTAISTALSASQLRIHDRHEMVGEGPVQTDSRSFNTFTLGVPSRLRDGDGSWSGFVSEVVFHPYVGSSTEMYSRYDDINAYWDLGPDDYARGALLPQQFEYQIRLYQWLESLNVADVSLSKAPFQWDGTAADVDALADLWLQLEGVTASSVVRGEPEWYVLDAGNGKGIEATGSVRVWHDPEGAGGMNSGYPGNPARSWSNEPAFLYQLDIPLANGSQGNPYYRDPAMGRRALVVAAVDMMMYHRAVIDGGFAGWTDMFGKALLGWTEAYRWAGAELDQETRQAFEDGFEYFLDRIISQGARAVNTNMDMFPMQAAAEVYMSTDDPVLRQKAVAAVRRTLFGYADGALDTRHDVFATQGYTNGVFGPAGYIMEGDQPDIFYQGESLYHLAGALMAVMDRETREIPSDWEFLDEVIRRMVRWEAYQMFYDPGGNSPGVGGLTDRRFYHAGAGFAGRTGASVPAGQANEMWKHATLADLYPDGLYRAVELKNYGSGRMASDIAEDVSALSSFTAQTYVGVPSVWDGWSPWTKKTPYLPPKGWYSRLWSTYSTSDPSTRPIAGRDDVTYNESFGGYPTGDEYWAYKNSDGTRDFGFFVEAHAKQGSYGGWYGGKIETFWTESTGVVILNRHGKTGCDYQFEDSGCWKNMDYKAGHHVWGSDENGNVFTTLLLRGQALERTSVFETEMETELDTPRVSVRNVFNDPSLNPTSSRTGEETGSELQGDVEIENTFEALENGIRVTHALTSDESDEVSELWASIPVFLRLFSSLREGDKPQRDMENTSIEYWDGDAWVALPEDTNGDGIPELVRTDALRLGRDYMRGAGPQYVYVDIDTTQNVRLSTQIYEDPYQTQTSVRTVHIDLHGNPGTVQNLPAEKTLSYSIVTQAPEGTASDEPVQFNQVIDLQPGWNIVSRSVELESAELSQVFAAIQQSVVLVKDEAGQVYIPEYGINEIGSWQKSEALMVNVDAPVSLEMLGFPIELPASSVVLNRGWNLMPYFPTTALSVTEALAGILDDVVLVKDRDGSLFLPEYGIDEIGMLMPGSGYKIYVNEATTLVFPAASGASKGGSWFAADDSPAPTGLFSGSVVVDAAISAESDIYSVWTADTHTRLGSAPIRSGRAVIPVAGDDPFTLDEIEGATSGQKLVLKRETDGGATDVAVASLTNALTRRGIAAAAWHFEQDGVWHARTSDVPTEFALRQNYPNPFNPSTTISYDVKERSNVRIEVFNAIGQRVALLADEEFEPGTHQVRFDAGHLSSGLYVYRMLAAGKSLTRKMMLFK